MTEKEKVLFDCRGILENCVALFMSDRKRVLVDKRRYYAGAARNARKESEDINVRKPERIRKPGNFRSGPAPKVEHQRGVVNQHKRAA
jgi:hypothetical protein